MGWTLRRLVKLHSTVFLLQLIVRLFVITLVIVSLLNPLFLAWDKWRKVKYNWLVQILVDHGYVRSDTCDNCFPNFYFHINPTELCTESRSQVELIILICSDPNNAAARHAIRTTWASITHSNTARVRHVFLFGSREDAKPDAIIKYESDKYGDIIQANFTDSYYNLTYKSVMGLQWATTYCPNAQFAMKTDDDMFINVTRLLERMADGNMATSLSGHCNSNFSKPHRFLTSKWWISVQDYPRHEYPPYCSGTGYILPLNLAQQVVKVSHNIPFFPMEDVYIGMCVHSLAYSVNNIQGFYIEMSPPFNTPLEMMVASPSNTCVWDNDVITLHETTPNVIQEIWKTCFMSASNSVLENT